MKKPTKNQKAIPAWAVRAKALMKANNIRQQDLADRLGMERNTVSHYLNGHREPSIDTVAAIASILGVYTSQLIGDAPLTHDDKQTQEILRRFEDADEDTRQLLMKMIRAACEQ